MIKVQFDAIFSGQFNNLHVHLAKSRIKCLSIISEYIYAFFIWQTPRYVL
jgi:hypothetical protein